MHGVYRNGNTIIYIVTESYNSIVKGFSRSYFKSTYHEPEQSNLVPGAKRWWDLEYAQPKWEYPDYDGFVTEPDGTWKKCFRFKLEEALLQEFEEEVSIRIFILSLAIKKCHLMHVDENRGLYTTSLIGRAGEKMYRSKKVPFWRGFFGYQEMEIIFVSNMHFVRSMKRFFLFPLHIKSSFRHTSLETVNSVITNELNINMPSTKWRCGSTINIMINPLNKNKDS